MIYIEDIWQKILLAFFYVVLFPLYAVICIRDWFRIISLYTKYYFRFVLGIYF